jgi:ankyrin repeat protein
MVNVNKDTDIFDLISNKSSTVEDFKRLYKLAPEKFIIYHEDIKYIYESARKNGRDEIVSHLETVINKSVAAKIVELVYEKASKLQEFLEDKDLKDLIKEEQEIIISNLFNNSDPLDISRKLFMLLNRGINVNTLVQGIGFIPDRFVSEIGVFKFIIQKYNFDINLKNIKGDTLLWSMIVEDEFNAVKYLVEKDADIHDLINGSGYLYYIYKYIPEYQKNKYYKLFLDSGIDPDQIIDQESEYTLLIYSIVNNNKENFDLLIEKDADVNKVSRNEYTPLCIASYLDDRTYYIKKLIEKGADVNYIAPSVYIQPDSITIKNVSILQQCIYERRSTDNIKLLLESGANKEHKETTTKKTALEIAKDRYRNDKKYYEKVIELLGGEVPGKELWKGFSRSDIQKFDIFFENPFDWSCCPICLEYIERSEACMYMSHDCATTGHYYHEDLYDDFMHSYGTTKKVEWCTICGRITELHKHFKLSLAKEPSKEKASLKPEIQERLDRGDNQAFYDNANCIGFGGGGIEEKAARFRRLREYALELQEDVGKRPEEEVLKELIEEVWNAPLVRNRKVAKILKDKKWNINVKNFPENKRSTRNNNNNSNAANVPFNGRVPTIVDKNCAFFMEDDDTNTRETNPKFHFRHETVGGIDHADEEGFYICQKDLAKSIEVKNAQFGLEHFGKCWNYPQCKGVLHPEELKDIISKELYEEYRKKFNKKMAKKGGRRFTKKLKQRGGNVKSVLHELKDGTCTPHLWTRDGKLRKLKRI